jgi:hypothetical protein
MESETKFNIELILEQLLELQPGELITYAELSALTGLSIQTDARYLLDAALRTALEEHNMVFENERNVGYRRLTDEDIVVSMRRFRRARTQAKLGMQELSKVKFDQLENKHRITHNAKFYGYICIAGLSHEGTIKKVELRISSPEEVIVNTQQALELFRQINDK